MGRMFGGGSLLRVPWHHVSGLWGVISSLVDEYSERGIVLNKGGWGLKLERRGESRPLLGG